MKRKYASREDIIRALKEMFKEHKVISSQSKLKDLVCRFLSEKSVGERRLRRIAIESKIAEIKIFTRESKYDFDLDICPVCNHKIEVVTGKDIWGNTSRIEFICKRCGYRSGVKRRIPIKYVFYSKEL